MPLSATIAQSQCPRSHLYIGASCGCARAASSGVELPAARAAVKELREDPPDVVRGTGSRAAVCLGLRGQIPEPNRTNPHHHIIISYQRLGASARQDVVTPGAGRGGLGGGCGIARRYATLEGDACERRDQRVCRRSVPRSRHRSPADRSPAAPQIAAPQISHIFFQTKAKGQGTIPKKSKR